MNSSKYPLGTGRILPGLAALSVLALSSLSANTLVYWDFEGGVDSARVGASDIGGDPLFNDTVLDSSGNGNHLRTWADFTAPTFRSDVPFGSVPRTGTANSLSLQTVPNQDLYTTGKDINSHVFTAWTIELSFKADVVDAFQVMVGKDGDTNASNHDWMPPVFIKTLANATLELGIVDKANVGHFLGSTAPLVTGEWYHVAATATATEASLWLMGPGDSNYVLQTTAAIEGALVESTGDWTVGRGMFNNGINDWYNGYIDEVRISDVALAPEDFLAIPEPSTYALFGGLGVLAVALLRRKKR